MKSKKDIKLLLDELRKTYTHVDGPDSKGYIRVINEFGRLLKFNSNGVQV